MYTQFIVQKIIVLACSTVAYGDEQEAAYDHSTIKVLPRLQRSCCGFDC